MKILITGGTNGIGKGVAKVLAAVNNQAHEIIILGRSQTLGTSTLNELEHFSGNKKLSFVLCDLTKLSDVKNVAKEIKSKHDYLDAVFINAGIGYAPKQEKTADGLDPHFQVNYLSQFMLLLHLMELLRRSAHGGRVIFNVTTGGKIYWNDLQMTRGWGYVKGIRQAMVAKRMLAVKLDRLQDKTKGPQLSFFGFEVPETVWTNQVNIIPFFMWLIAGIMKFFGRFISIEKCGKIMAPLFTENKYESSMRSGKLFTWRQHALIELKDDPAVYHSLLQDRLWNTSLSLCNDAETVQLAKDFANYKNSSTSFYEKDIAAHFAP